MAVGSFSAGLSGLNANSVYLNVIGNNLSNINTIGFKASSVTFMNGRIIGMRTFGASAPAKDLQKKFGFTTDAVITAAREALSGSR